MGLLQGLDGIARPVSIFWDVALNFVYLQMLLLKLQSITEKLFFHLNS